MASNIDTSQPPATSPTTAAMRANMLAAKTEIEALQGGAFAAISAGSTGAMADNGTPSLIATNAVISGTKTKGSTDPSLLWIGSNNAGAFADLNISAVPSKTEALALVPSFKLLANINWVQGFYIHNTFITDGVARTLSATYGMFIQSPEFAADVTVTSSYGIRIQPQKITGDIITNVYGIFINGQDPDGNSNSWGIWSDSPVYAWTATLGASKLFMGGTGPTNALIQWTGTQVNFYKGDSTGRVPIECGQVKSYASSILLTVARTITLSTDAGTAGEICWDANFIYTCVAANTWKRAALTTW